MVKMPVLWYYTYPPARLPPTAYRLQATASPPFLIPFPACTKNFGLSKTPPPIVSAGLEPSRLSKLSN